jgi:hypothetical protein
LLGALEVRPTSDRVVSTDSSADAPGLDGRVNRLAAERSALFRRAGATLGGLSNPEHTRLKAIERELDECFALRVQQRAARDARRFSRYV